jgi:hypothetical protein
MERLAIKLRELGDQNFVIAGHAYYEFKTGPALFKPSTAESYLIYCRRIHGLFSKLERFADFGQEN